MTFTPTQPLAQEELEVHASDYRDDDFIAPHSHHQAQLIHAVSGVMLVDSARGSWVVPFGHALWIPSQVAHQIRMNGGVRMRTLFLAPLSAGALGRECQVIEVSPLLRELIVSAADAPQGERRKALFNLLRLELQAAPPVALHVPLPADRRLAILCSRFIGNPSEASSLDDCARALNMSPRTLSRAFRRELGMSFGEWRRRARLMLSLQRLARGASILEVALDHGYQSPSAFSAMFKRRFGKSPSHYQALEKNHRD